MKKNILIMLLAPFAVLTMAVSCKEDPEAKASVFYANALDAFAQKNYTYAKQQIDSIRIVCPKAFQTRKNAISLMQKIEESEQLRTIAYEDSVLTVLKASLQKSLSPFKLEKNAEYQDMGNWVVESQNPENNVGRCYLRAQVEETGKITLISTWCGNRNIHHNSVKVTVGDTYAQSPVTDDIYEYKDLGVCYEKCNLKDGEDGGIAAFIALNRDKDIRMSVMSSDGKGTAVTLTPKDRKSIAQLYDLSQVLKTIAEHQAMRDEADRKLKFTRAHMQSGTEASGLE